MDAAGEGGGLCGGGRLQLLSEVILHPDGLTMTVGDKEVVFLRRIFFKIKTYSYYLIYLILLFTCSREVFVFIIIKSTVIKLIISKKIPFWF